MGEGKDGHEPSEGEQKIIDNWMPEGSVMGEASKNREEWHKRLEIKDTAVIKEIGELSHHIVKEKGFETIFGKVKGHSYSLDKIELDDGVIRYFGNIDGNPLSDRYATILFRVFSRVLIGIDSDTEFLSKSAKKEQEQREREIIDDLLGEK
ncbi:MAG: hypothetical protein Athens101428_53 [Candidatus Berkelbacteria bacterium Athens1014_28]|uniref:Uncharacterized protein n=1 Tax=Candidatus Berkelbacteria bacterium Athens1014_28 TaxID=2017145 RepID=A0A554LQ19_9BACT|nr:MAG: hypothetical protein Athens101428_53 [Candidatus Berkelbacteria bacterium Athens1014_28]